MNQQKRQGPRSNSRSAQPRQARIDPARRAAYDVLHDVGKNDAYANVALAALHRTHDIDSRDAAFCTQLVNGTLRYRGLLDAVIENVAKRPLDKIDPRIVDVLRMGAFQVLLMRTDDHAAVDTTVELARSVAGEAPVGLVNAVMRKIAAQSRDEWVAVLTESASPQQAMAIEYSHPEWIISALRDALGPQRAADLPALLATNNEPASVTLAARPGLATVDDLVADGASVGRWSPYAAIAPSGHVSQMRALRKRHASVQDEGSQLVAIALTLAEVEGSDTRWLDMCAGPGGKLALLATVGALRGAQTTAIEQHEHRARLIENSVAGMPGLADIVVADARDKPAGDGFDRVLVDVPCTGLGVVRRRPELRWRRTPADVAALRRTQIELLNAALDVVRPGGVVGYATCSPHLAETELVVSSVTRRRDDVEIEDSRNLFPGVSDLGEGPNVRLWPHLHGTDGMFFSLMRRTA